MPFPIYNLSVVDSNKALGGSKKIDLFEPARIDSKHTIEEIVTSLKTLVDEGLFSYIGLSEVSADTLRRASKACQQPEILPRHTAYTFDYTDHKDHCC